MGSAASRPSADRNPSGIFLKAQGSTILLDCGQGTQRQLLKYGCDFFVDVIVISHHHSDHDAGLLPYLQSMNLLHRKKPLIIYTPEPKRVEEYLHKIKIDEYSIEVRAPLLEVPYLHSEYDLTFYRAKHGAIKAISCKLVSNTVTRRNREKLLLLPIPIRKQLCEKGTSTHENRVLYLEDYLLPPRPRFQVYYSGDTTWIPEVVDRISDKGLIIHECTYVHHEDLCQARKRNHTHVSDINIPVHDHLLTHISQKVTADILDKKYSRVRGKWARDGMTFENKCW